MLYDCVTLCPIVNQYSCGQGKSHYKNEVEEIHQENPRFTKCKWFWCATPHDIMVTISHVQVLEVDMRV